MGECCNGRDGYACSNTPRFVVKRIHDGGGRRTTCGIHLATAVEQVAASVPEWATDPTHAVRVTELSG